MTRNVRVLVAGVVGLAVFGLVWELVVRMFGIRPFVLMPPSRIVAEFLDDPEPYLRAAVVTAYHTLAGLAISLVVSVALGALLASSRFAEEAVQPVLVLVLVTPWVAYVTSLVIWLGSGDPPAVFLVAFVTLPAFTFAMVAGLRSADGSASEVLASVDASRWETLWRLRLPSAMPTLFAAGRFNAGLALAAAYFVEGSNYAGRGLGYIGAAAAGFNDGPILWTAIATTVVLGILLLVTLTVLERTVLRWHVSQRA